MGMIGVPSFWRFPYVSAPRCICPDTAHELRAKLQDSGPSGKLLTPAHFQGVYLHCRFKKRRACTSHAAVSSLTVNGCVLIDAQNFLKDVDSRVFRARSYANVAAGKACFSAKGRFHGLRVLGFPLTTCKVMISSFTMVNLSSNVRAHF